MRPLQQSRVFESGDSYSKGSAIQSELRTAAECGVRWSPVWAVFGRMLRMLQQLIEFEEGAYAVEVSRTSVNTADYNTSSRKAYFTNS